MNTIVNVVLEKYPLAMRVLHWLLALLILGNLALGWYMVPYQEDQPVWDDYYDLHKSFGVLVFMLLIVRLIVKHRNQTPALPATLPKLDKTLAKVGHTALYILMFAVPVFGYGMSSTFEYSSGVPFFSLFHVPEVISKSEFLYELFEWLHAVCAYVLLAVVVLHIAGALKHRFFDKDKRNDVLSRML